MENTKMITLRINGNDLTVPVQPGQTLADVLRETLDLTGTKIGCNEDECGICTVLVDAEPILSCTYPAVRAQGKKVITIEGLASLSQNGNLSAHARFLQYEN